MNAVDIIINKKENPNLISKMDKKPTVKTREIKERTAANSNVSRKNIPKISGWISMLMKRFITKTIRIGIHGGSPKMKNRNPSPLRRKIPINGNTIASRMQMKIETPEIRYSSISSAR